MSSSSINNWFSTIGVSETDPEQVKSAKQMVIQLAALMSFGGLVWGCILLNFNLNLPALIPLGYVVLSGINVFYFHHHKHFKVTAHLQVTISMLLPFFLQWTLGGFYPSGGVMLWSVLSVVGSIILFGVKKPYPYVLVFVVLVVISYVIDTSSIKFAPPVFTPAFANSLLLLNILLIIGISIFLLKTKIDHDAVVMRVLTELQIQSEKSLCTERATQQKLQISENRYRKLMEESQVLICTHDMQGCLISINHTGARVLEYQVEELIGKSIEFLLPVEFKKEFQPYLDQIIRNKSCESFMSIETKSKRRLIFLFRNLLMEEPGQEPYVMGSAQDVTEWRKSENREAKISKDLKLIVSSMDDFVIEFDETGRFKNFWCRDESKLSKPVTYYTGKTLAEAFAFSPEFVEKAQKVYNNVVLTKQPFVTEIDKGWISAKMSYQIRLNPIVELDGSVKRCTALVSDITLRKEAERKLKESYRTQKLLLENLEGAVIIEDVSRKIRLVNDEFCRMFGIPLSPDQLIGVDCSESAEQIKDLFCDSADFPKRITEILNGMVKVLDEELELVDGRVLERDYIPIFFNDHHHGHMWHYHDITRRKQTERALTAAKEEAEESNRLKTIFLGNLSHEVRTPLQGILGFAEILENPGLTTAKRNEYLSIIKRRTNDMQNIIESLLDMASLETGEIKAFPQAINLRETVESIFTKISHDHDLSGKGIRLELRNELEDLSIAMVDPQHLQQVIVNLISNAVKFTHRGVITFLAEGSATQYKILVKDTGIGIPEEMLDHIFEPFRQAHEGMSRSKGGIGLGLSICKKMVEMWGGEIYVESKPDHGSAFHFTIPVPVEVINTR